MKGCGRLSCAAAAAFVLSSCGSALAGSELQLRWSELAPVVSGRTATVVLLRGAVLRGQVLSVGPEALYIQVKGTSYTDAYRKGRAEIPRKSVAVVELTRTNVLRKVFTGVGIGVGSAVVAAGVVFVGAASESSASRSEDPKATRHQLKATLIFVGALSVAVGTKFGIDAARGKGHTTVMTIRVIPEPE